MGKAYGIEYWNDDKSWMYDRHVLLERICNLYMNNTNFSAGYCMWLRDQIWSFIESADNEEQVEILNDSAHGDMLYTMERGEFDWINNRQIAEPEYKKSGERYCNEEVWQQWISDNY
jgi:hypothetical protein